MTSAILAFALEKRRIKANIIALRHAVESIPVPINGGDGKDGINGLPGRDGKDGEDGKDGRGIANVRIERQYLVVEYDDGTSETVGRMPSAISPGINYGAPTPRIHVGPTAPDNPNVGDVWIESR